MFYAVQVHAVNEFCRLEVPSAMMQVTMPHLSLSELDNSNTISVLMDRSQSIDINRSVSAHTGERILPNGAVTCNITIGFTMGV